MCVNLQAYLLFWIVDAYKKVLARKIKIVKRRIAFFFSFFVWVNFNLNFLDIQSVVKTCQLRKILWGVTWFLLWKKVSYKMFLFWLTKVFLDLIELRNQNAISSFNWKMHWKIKILIFHWGVHWPSATYFPKKILSFV